MLGEAQLRGRDWLFGQKHATCALVRLIKTQELNTYNIMNRKKCPILEKRNKARSAKQMQFRILGTRSEMKELGTL